MQLNYHKNFKKSFHNRISPHENLVRRFEERFELFLKHPKNPVLKDHALIGRKIKLRAFSITGNIRVVYLMKGNDLYLLDIGSHNQVY